MRLHDVGARVDAQVTVFLAQARVGVALFQIDEPALDAVSQHVILRYRVARTVALADIAVHAEVLNAKLARLIFHKRQVRGHKARTKARTVLFVDQAAVAAEIAETNLIKNRNRLHFAWVRMASSSTASRTFQNLFIILRYTAGGDE